jgi:CubicO group peptidase (beta-lactamase class C family)
LDDFSQEKELRGKVGMNFTKLGTYLNTLEEKYEVHGLDCKVMQEHKTIYRYMTGHSDYTLKVPVSENDLYEVYSCTKIITMTAVMQLVEQGRIGLYDELEKYLPEFGDMQIATDFRIGEWPFKWPTLASPLVPARNKILIHDLMSMTTGLSYDVASEVIQEKKRETGNKAGTREMIETIARMPLLCEPGTRFSYALGHDVLAAVVEILSGMTFGQYLKKNIFDPLAITELYFRVPDSEKYRISAQYMKDMVTGVIAPHSGMIFRLSDAYESGGAGLTCTVDAYSMVLDALANDGVGATGVRILTPESIRTMSKNWLTDQQLEDFKKSGKVGYGYGLGVRTLIDGTHSKSPLGEFGWDGAAGAYALIDPINHISIFYAHEILGMITAYSEIHPTIRDLAYEAVKDD